MTSEISTAAAREAIAPNGVLRAAINYGNPVLVRRDAETGKTSGVVYDLATTLAAELGVPLEMVTYDAARLVHESAAGDQWDICFLAIDPVRAEVIDFTRPYHIIEGTYAVRAESPLASVKDVDREGHRVLVGGGSAYDLFLTRELKHAVLERVPSGELMDRYVAGSFDACGGIRQPLTEFVGRTPGYRVMPDSFMDIRQAMGTPRGRDPIAVAFLDDYVAGKIDSGFVARSVAAR